MAFLSTIFSRQVGSTPPPASVSHDAKALVEQYNAALRIRLQAEKFKPHYHSIDEILTEKFHLQDIDNIEGPSYVGKTGFISKGVRGNFQKASGNVLTYAEADEIISDAIEEDLP
jgi:hypothetical protein